MNIHIKSAKNLAFNNSKTTLFSYFTIHSISKFLFFYHFFLIFFIYSYSLLFLYLLFFFTISLFSAAHIHQPPPSVKKNIKQESTIHCQPLPLNKPKKKKATCWKNKKPTNFNHYRPPSTPPLEKKKKNPHKTSITNKIKSNFLEEKKNPTNFNHSNHCHHRTKNP